MKRTAAKRSINAKGFFALHKKKLLIVTIVAAAIGVTVGYVTWSILSWQYIGSSAASTSQSVKTDIASLTKQKVTSKELARRAESIKADIETLCVSSPLIKWQSRVVSSAKEALARCEQARQQLQVVQAALEAIVQRVASEQRMAQKLHDLQDRLSRVAKDDYAASREEWKTFGAEVEHEATHSSLNASKQAAKDAVSEIIAGYDKLVAANKVEKRADFDIAVAEIEKGYSKLGAVQNSSVDTYTTLLDSLQQASGKLE